ncbi:MAG TPA: electron transfer flavoprotein subunit alpha/FixB family protein [Candidatus Caldiarchaeum subterraneum]|uniref:Electron transfer flavoprotein subunit alpha/FixB family protein n=1 Tax=Caldiarchaeum subterraneum TaxID=311458 RepID=A0A832ZVQ3_CALS0|nr:electron transfer flavoprotein subunit alpha/FixB family protein [Aigarchaeota archaeon]HIQ29548.1 electron transfer flavoprotein subunit alpha/FixB family protein [Candidatus Caldarchaeum subterraneum]
MTTILTYSDTLQQAAEVLTLAKQLAPALNAEAYAIHIGELSQEAISFYGQAGAKKIYHIEDGQVSKGGPAVAAEALADTVSRVGAEVLLVAATRFGLETAPRVAQRLSTGYAAECFEVRVEEGSIVAYRGVLGGTYHAEVVMKKRPCVISVQTGRYQPSLSGAAETPQVEKIEVSPSAPSVELIEVQQSEAGEVELEKAELIVSVGRGFKKKEDLALAEELAKVVGAEIGCSRPIAGDLKWLPEERHIGLSGKRVRPKLYLALGISGQVQHLVGMRDSKTVIAINTDPNAPIMQESDYAVVGDLYKIIPLLTEKLKQTLGK